MSIRQKTVIIFAVSLTGLFIALYFVSSNILLGGFARLEDQDTRDDLARVQEAIQNDISNLNVNVQDWAQWDDSYNFVQDENEEYLKTNLNDTALAILKVNLLLEINSSGKIVFGTAFDLKTRSSVPLDEDFKRLLTPDNALLQHEDIKRSLSGLILINGTPTLIVSRPILTSQGEGPAAGNLIMGRYIDAGLNEPLSERTRLTVKIYPVTDPQLPSELKSLIANRNNGILVSPLNEEVIGGYTLLKDIYGNPALVLGVEAPRDNYAQGKTTLFYLFTFLLVVGLFFGGLTLFVLERSILSRLAYVGQAVKKVGINRDLSVRVPDRGRDEISTFGQVINQTLEALEWSQQAEQESEKRYRQLVELSPDAILVHEKGICLFINSAGAKLLGANSPEELTGTSLISFIHPDYRETLTTYSYEVRHQDRNLELEEGKLVRLDGQIIDLEILSSPIYYDGKPALQSILRDITERKRTEKVLRRYQLLSENSSEIIFFLNSTGDILEANQAAVKTYGYSLEELLALNVYHLRAPGHQGMLEEQLRLANEEEARFETYHRHKNGTIFPVEVSSRGISFGDERVLLSVVRDISERKQFQDLLHRQAFYDNLTDLPNRRLFNERLKLVLERNQKSDKQVFAVLFLDLDRFKVVNDSLGHIIGDQLLVAIAQRLKHCLRPQDMVARLGGDEFTILLDGIKNVHDASHIAERIQQELSKPFNLQGQEVFTSASIGIAISETGYMFPEEILRDADTAMYRAKNYGKARYEIFGTEMHIRAVSELELENELRRAIERGELQLYYQPVVSFENERVVGFEALVRWQHPKRGIIPPMDFIPIAEETGEIITISNWILQEACRQVGQWQKHSSREHPLWISVNLSSKQFLRPGLPEQIEALLKENQILPECLRLEITEHLLMRNTDLAIAQLKQLQQLGIKLYLDDFGTGYSSLSYLHRFPIHALKIDRSFVSRVQSDEKRAAIVPAIISLARNLDMEVVAEGVETQEQAGWLKEINCDLAQGYFYSRPVPAADIEKMLPEWCGEYKPNIR